MRRASKLLLVTLLALVAACGGPESAPVREDALTVLARRFPAAGAWLADTRPVEIARRGGALSVRERLPERLGPWRATRRALAAEIKPDEPARMVVTAATGARIGVEREGVGAVEGAGDHLALRGAGGELVGAVFASPRGLEEVVVGAGAVRYRLDLPPGWRLRQPAGRDELAELRDAGDVPRMRFVARWAFDEAGGRHRLRVLVGDHELTVVAPADRGPLLIDPEWQDTGTPSEDRAGAMVTSLADGRVLLVGGGGVTGSIQSADTFDPLTGTFEALSSGHASRTLGTATLLSDGSVLTAGGDAFGPPSPLERIDPESGDVAGPAAVLEAFAHTATRLPDGDILFAGGFSAVDPGSGSVAATDAVYRFDPTSGEWTQVGILAEARGSHRATLLSDGTVLLSGGMSGVAALSSVERYDPVTNQSAVVGSLVSGRHAHTALLLPQLGAQGQLLVAGGYTELLGGALDDVSLYDLQTGQSTVVGMLSELPRGALYAALLPKGDALLLGGGGGILSATGSGADRFDATQASLTPLPPPPGFFELATGVPLSSGEQLILGSDEGPLIFAAPEHETVAVVASLPFAVTDPSVTLLASGKALITEGGDAALFDPRTQTASMLPDLLPGIGRWHRATTLLDGRVLLSGGLLASGYASDVALLLDPATMAATEVATMKQARAAHLQTLLPDGRVLLVGGFQAYDLPSPTPELPLPTGEIFDPKTEQFVLIGSGFPAMAFGRALVLSDGLVRLWNGFAPGSPGGYGAVSFDPVSGWIQEDPSLGEGMAAAGCRIPDGRLFMVDFFGNGRIVDPVGGALPVALDGALWDGPALPTSRTPAVVPLASGRILVVGADDPVVHLVDPHAGTVTELSEPAAGRWMDAAALLPDGGVLLAGAIGQGAASDVVSIWYEAAHRPDWPPTLEPPTADLAVGQLAMLSGSGLLGVSEGVSATMMAAADAPVAFLLFEGGGIARGTSEAWDASGFGWRPKPASLFGPGILFASTMGLVGGAPAVLGRAPAAAACAADVACLSGHCVDGICCDRACEACEACRAELKVDGPDGICGPALAGSDPHDDCATDPVFTCRQDGSCDGAGQCALYPDGTTCDEAQLCHAGSCVEQYCDGDHTVVSAAGSSDCSPYACNPETNACLGRCDSNLDCAAGYGCNPDGSCVERPPASEPLGCAPCMLGAPAEDGSERAPMAWAAALLLALARRRTVRRTFRRPSTRRC